MDTINIVIAISAAATAISTAGLVLFAITQWLSFKKSIIEASKNRSVTVLLKIHDVMGELRPFWHELYGLPNNYRRWSKKQQALADRVGTELQRISFLCENQLVDPEFVIDGYGTVFARCWDKLSEFIKAYRVKSGEPAELALGGYQRKHFELFAQRCKKRFPEIDSGLLSNNSGG